MKPTALYFITTVFLSLALSSERSLAQNIDWIVNVDNTGSDPVPALDTIEISVDVFNGGTETAPPTTVSFNVPPETTITQIDGLAGCSPGLPASAPASITCDIPTLGPDANVIGTVFIQTQIQGIVTFTATVPTQGDVDPDNNSSTVTTTVQAGADLEMTILGAPTLVAGVTDTYTFRVENLGPNTASGMVLSFPIPTGVDNIIAPGACSLSGGVYTCPVPGILGVNDTFDFDFSFQVVAGSGFTVTPLASVEAGTPTDALTDNNTATFDILVGAGSDLRMSKSRSPGGTLLVGDTATFTLNTFYSGDEPFNITVTDTVPNNYNITNATGSGWTCDISDQTVTCERPGGTGPGANVALPGITIETEVVASGNPTNSASVVAEGPLDPNLANNADTDNGATIEDPFIDLQARKTGPTPPLTVLGNEYTFSIRAKNQGNADFFGTVVLEDQIPSGMTITSLNPNGWSCSPGLPLEGPTTLTCERLYTSSSPLAPNANTPFVNVTVEITEEGVQNNILTVSSPDGNLPDENPGNDTTSITTTASTGPNSTDVQLIKTAQESVLEVGNVQTFTLQILNNGPITAKNIDVVDDFTQLINNIVGGGYVGHSITPGIASSVSCSTSSLSSTGRRLSCQIDELPVCSGPDCPSIEVQIRPGGNGGTRTNTAEAFSQNVADPITANNTDSVSYNVTPRADVTVTKVASPTPAVAGQNLTYVVTATNIANGLSQAENVTITDILPENVTFVSASPSAGTCSTQPTSGDTTGSADEVVCNLGTIANGAQRTVTVIVRPNTGTRGGNIVNNVEVTTTTPEIDTTNNSDEISVFVENPVVDMAVTKTETIDPVAVGDDTVYNIVVRNNGPSTAENIVMTDTLPATRLAYRSHIISPDGTCSTVPAVNSVGGTLECAWPSLSSGATRTVTVTMRGVLKGVGVNTVSVQSDETLAGFDTNPGNNTAIENTTVRTRANMTVSSKTPSEDPVNLREEFFYNIIVENLTGPGLNEADEVELTDNLPSGMQLTGTPTVTVNSGAASVQACTGAAGDTGFTCNLGTVSSGAQILIAAPVQIVEVQSL